MGDAFYNSDFIDFAPNTPLLGTVEELERDVNAGQVCHWGDVPRCAVFSDADRAQNSVQTPPDLAQSIVANQLQHQPPVHWQHVEQYGGARLRPASSSNLNAQAEVFTPLTQRTWEANRAFDTPVYNGTYDSLPALGTAQWQSSMAPAQPAMSFMPFVTPPPSQSSHHHTASSSQPSALGSQVHVSPPMLGPGYITPQSSVSGALPQDLVNMLPQELSYTTQAARVPGMNVQLAPQSPDWRRGFQQQNAGSQSPSFQRQIRRLNVPGNPVGPSLLPPVGPDIDIWNQTQYQPGDYTSAFTGSNSTAPQRPMTANRRRSRAGSQAASTSRSFGLHACDFDGCNRSYSNRADLE